MNNTFKLAVLRIKQFGFIRFVSIKKLHPLLCIKLQSFQISPHSLFFIFNGISFAKSSPFELSGRAEWGRIVCQFKVLSQRSIAQKNPCENISFALPLRGFKSTSKLGFPVGQNEKQQYPNSLFSTRSGAVVRLN